MRLDFRFKFFLVLLAFSLVPLLAVRIFMGTYSQRLLSEATLSARQDMVDLMGYGLEESARGAAEVIRSQSMAYAQSSRILSMEAQRLRPVAGMGNPEALVPADSFESGADASGMEPSRRHLRRTRSGNIRPIPVDEGHLSLNLAPGVKREDVEQDIRWVSSLLPSMRSVYEDLGKVMWLDVHLVSGVSVSYPAHGLPKHYDPRITAWYQRMIQRMGPTWAMPIVDPATRRNMGGVGCLIRSADGRVQGLAVVSILISDILQSTTVESEWGQDQQPFLLLRQDNPETGNPGLLILGQADYEQGQRHWLTPFEHEWLASDNATQFDAFLQRVHKEQSGVMYMPYKGRDSVWAFASHPEYTYTIIVPEKAVTRIPDSILEGVTVLFRHWRWYTGAGILAVVLLSGLGSWIMSRSSTRPLMIIANAARRLSDGDFDVHVDLHTGDERDYLIGIVNEMGPRLKEHMQISRDMELARSVQEHLLPASDPDIEGWDIAGCIRYCDQTGGDYYDFLGVNGKDGHAHAVVVGDVSGHGLPSALLMSSARALVHGLSGARVGLGRRMGMINSHLNADLEGTGRFLTMFYLQLQPESCDVRWVRAGHDPAILYDPATDSMQELSGDGLPLGVVPDCMFEECSGCVPPGAMVVMATDGVWEAMDTDRTMFGRQRFLAIVRQNAHKRSEDVAHAVLHAVQEFMGSAEQKDDITVVVAKRTGKRAIQGGERGMQDMSFRMTNKQRCFEIFRPKVEEFCRANGLEPRVVFRLTLVIDELITNIISYGYSDMDEHPIDVFLSTDGERVVLRIEDDAEPFNILEAPEPELDTPLDERERPIGGMGIHLVKKMANCLSYTREQGKNVIVLEKTLNEDCTC